MTAETRLLHRTPDGLPAVYVSRWSGEVAEQDNGDIAAGNLLLVDGELAAVIDFGTCGVGDPSCDLAVVWTLLTATGRHAFRERLSVSEAAWARGRGWALWKTLAACAHDVRKADEQGANAWRVLGEIFAEYAAGGRSTVQAATGA